jgi:hypothetical protein
MHVEKGKRDMLIGGDLLTDILHDTIFNDSHPERHSYAFLENLSASLQPFSPCMNFCLSYFKVIITIIMRVVLEFSMTR